jgi:putative endonuclease
MKLSHVYITTNKNKTVLYTGVTSNLVRRIYQHKTKFYKGFTSRYNCNQLVYYQEFTDIREAIAYEKKLKAGNRARKEKVINDMNPEWKDLSEGWVFNVE